MKKLYCIIMLIVLFVTTIGCNSDVGKGEEVDVGNRNKAWQYVMNNMDKVNKRYRQTFHASSPIGWINDPNGFCYALSNYHLFYQFNPYDIKWGPMHWGHFTTKDFVKWELQPIALAPDKSYDSDLGCFSGSAIEKDDKMYIMYTGVANGLQTQILAESSNGIKFNKIFDKPIIDVDKIPQNSSHTDFRDPKVFKKGKDFYAIIGSKNIDGDGQILLYKSPNLKLWNYIGIILKSSLTKPGIFECPDIFNIGDNDIIMASPQFYPTDGSRFENVHSVVYMVGKLNLESGEFVYDSVEEIDSGFDFYASQTLKTPDDRIIMTAWMQMWDRTYPTADDGYVGSMILPRELTLRDGKLIQLPVREIEKYRNHQVSYGNVLVKENTILDDIKGKTLELDMEFEINGASKCGIKLFEGSDKETLVYYNQADSTVIFDRTNSGEVIKTSASKEKNANIRSCKVRLDNGKLKMRIFIDKSSVEIFINDGENAMTGNVYPPLTNDGISFFSNGGESVLKHITKYDILVGGDIE